MVRTCDKKITANIKGYDLVGFIIGRFEFKESMVCNFPLIHLQRCVARAMSLH